MLFAIWFWYLKKTEVKIDDVFENFALKFCFEALDS